MIIYYYLGGIEVKKRAQLYSFSTCKTYHTETMSSRLSNLTLPNVVTVGQGAGTVFSPYLQHVHALGSLQARRDDSCTQTVEVPVWYGLDYNTCSMQTTTAACSVSFLAVSCHTSPPLSQPLPEKGLSATTQLWIVIGVRVFFVIFIPVAVLWARWKLSTRRRGGKRSVSVQLEKNEGAKSKSESAPESTEMLSIVGGDGPERRSGGRSLLGCLWGRRRLNATQSAGKYC